MAEPSRRLAPKGNASKPHRYTTAAHTDIRRTFRRTRLLAHLQRNKETTP